MNGSGLVVAIIGIVVVILGIIRHFSTFLLASTKHVSIALVVIGVIVLIVGVLMARGGRPALG